MMTAGNLVLDFEVDNRALLRALRIAPQELRKELYGTRGEFDHVKRSFLGTFRRTRLQGPPGIFGDGRTGLFGTFKGRRLKLHGNLLDMGMEVYSTSKKIGPRHEFGRPLLASGKDLLVPMTNRMREHYPEMFTKGKRSRLKKSYQKVRKTGTSRSGRTMYKLGKLDGIFDLNTGGSRYLVKRYGPKKLAFLFARKSKVEYKDALGFYQTWDKFIPNAITYLNRGIHRAINNI